MADGFLRDAMAIRGVPIPVIAKVNGWCMGGGHELALWCDLVIASENAVLGQTGAKVGACPTVGATQYLPLILGERLAARGRLAVAMDLLTDSLALVGQHGVYCRSERFPGQPKMDIALVLEQLHDAKALVQSAMDEMRTR